MADRNEPTSNNDGVLHPITQVEDSGDDEDSMEFLTALFGDVLTQVDPEEEPEVSCVVAPPSPPAPAVVTRCLHTILHEDERKRRQTETAEK